MLRLTAVVTTAELIIIPGRDEERASSRKQHLNKLPPVTRCCFKSNKDAKEIHEINL